MAPKTKNSGCYSADFLKYVLYIYNILYLIAGCIVFGTACWTIADKFGYVNLLTTSTYVIITYFLLAAGALALLVTIIGCCAISKGNRPLLLIYIFLLLLIFLIEAMVGILAFVYREQLHNELDLNLNTTFTNEYGYVDAKTDAIDFLQTEFNCCGANNFAEWNNSKWRTENPSNLNLVPDSCCKTFSFQCGKRTHPSNINYYGCLDIMENHMKIHLAILCAVGLGICVIQVFGIIYACCLYFKLKDVDIRT